MQLKYYECPYCPPAIDNRLVLNRLDGAESKPVYKCGKCGEEFFATEDFRRTQYRKIKDG